MKNLFFIFFLSLFFLISCDEGMRITKSESENKPDESQNDDADTDQEVNEGDTVPDDSDTVKDDTDSVPDDNSDSTPDDNGDSTPDDNSDSTPDDNCDSTPDDNSDSTPDDNGDSTPDDNSDSTPDDNGDSTPDDDTDTAEEPDDGSECENGTTRTKKCTDLPQNAEWNTAEYVQQVCGNEGFAPSNAGTYNAEAASSTFANTTPSSKEPLPPDCPEGTGDVDGLCEYTGCAQYAYVMYFTSKNGTIIYKHDPTSTCFKEPTTSSEQAPCCCGKPIYKFSKSGDIQETYDPAVNPMNYADSFYENGNVASTDTWVCTPTIPCENDYKYGKETGKCYKCSGELSFDGTQYQCFTEIGTECRFKCKTAFKWNGESCI